MLTSDKNYYTQYYAKFSRIYPDEKTAIDEARDFVKSNVVRVINGTKPMIYTREIDVDSGNYYYAESQQQFNGRLPGSASKVMYYVDEPSGNTANDTKKCDDTKKEATIAYKMLYEIAKDIIPVYEYATFEPLAPFENNITGMNVFNRFTQLTAVQGMRLMIDDALKRDGIKNSDERDHDGRGQKNDDAIIYGGAAMRYAKLKIRDECERRTELTLYHIKEVLCGGCDKVFRYVMGYLAHIIQYPRKKPPSALVFISSQGVGKNLFFDAFVSRVIGLRWAGVYDDIAHLLGRFNGHLEGKLLCVLDEAKNCRNTAAQEADVNKLKAFITRSNIVIERKGKDVGSVAVRDYNRLIILSNNDTPVKIENTDRRFCVVRCRDPGDVLEFVAKKAQDERNATTKTKVDEKEQDDQLKETEHKEEREKEREDPKVDAAQAKRNYFDDLAAEISSDEWAASLAFVMMEWDLSNWNPASIPDTSEKQRMKLEGLTSGANFIAAYLLDSLPDVCEITGDIENGWIDKQKCYPLYKKYCTYSAYPLMSQRDFDMEMIAICGPVQRFMVGGVRMYMFDMRKEAMFEAFFRNHKVRLG